MHGTIATVEPVAGMARSYQCANRIDAPRGPKYNRTLVVHRKRVMDMNAGLLRAHAVNAQRAVAGIKPQRKIVSRAKALMHYFLELEGVLDDAGNRRRAFPDQNVTECRQIAREKYRAARGEHNSLKRAVQDICFECVGNADPGPRLRVRDCSATTCPLHAIRPHQQHHGHFSIKANIDTDPNTAV